MSFEPHLKTKDSGLPWPGETSARRRAPDGVSPGYKISFTRYFYKPQPLRPWTKFLGPVRKPGFSTGLQSCF